MYLNVGNVKKISKLINYLLEIDPGHCFFLYTKWVSNGMNNL